jgi:hypothetical protein
VKVSLTEHISFSICWLFHDATPCTYIHFFLNGHPHIFFAAECTSCVQCFFRHLRRLFVLKLTRPEDLSILEKGIPNFWIIHFKNWHIYGHTWATP